MRVTQPASSTTTTVENRFKPLLVCVQNRFKPPTHMHTYTHTHSHTPSLSVTHTHAYVYNQAGLARTSLRAPSAADISQLP